MNILAKSLPTKIQLGNDIYDINYDYRTVIRILIAFEDESLTYEDKIYVMLKNIYKKEIPNEYMEEAIKKAIKFIDCGEDYRDVEKKQRIYSFKKDANYIFTGINSTHHIDIEKEHDLHWWKFMFFFMDMSTDCMFGELVYYRTRKAEGKLTKEEKKQYQKIKDLVELEEIHKESEARKQFFQEFHKT